VGQIRLREWSKNRRERLPAGGHGREPFVVAVPLETAQRRSHVQHVENVGAEAVPLVVEG